MALGARSSRMRVVTAFLASLLPLLLCSSQASSETKHGGELRIFFVDVEGGQATLFVTPAQEALLIDTGWPGNEGRDADRIVAAAKSAGLTIFIMSLSLTSTQITSADCLNWPNEFLSIR